MNPFTPLHWNSLPLAAFARYTVGSLSTDTLSSAFSTASVYEQVLPAATPLSSAYVSVPPYTCPPSRYKKYRRAPTVGAQ